MNNNFDLDNIDVEKLVAEKKAFCEFVYTPMEEVADEFRHRWKDKDLEKRVGEYLKGDIPKPLADGFRAVIFRHICTPSYEIERFIGAADELGWEPVFGEYHQDKFTSNNPIKYYLGKIPFHSGYGKRGGAKIAFENIIDFNLSNGKSFSAIKTEWGQPLVDFHHELFFKRYPNICKEKFYESSEWFNRNGRCAKKYYNKFLSLFIRNGVLFENFSIGQKEERIFAKEYFLPAFIRILRELSIKPLIVDLAPMDIDGDIYWLSHRPEDAAFIERKRELGYNFNNGPKHLSRA